MIIKVFYLLKQPEYIALLISVIAVIVNVHISNKNRKHSLAKEEYFKLQQIVEKIIAKLLILDNDHVKCSTYLELAHRASNTKNSVFIDSNNTLNKDDFEKNGEDITAWIDIYFGEISPEWNTCLDLASKLHTQIFILSKKIESNDLIDWEKEIKEFNDTSRNLAHKPKLIADRLKVKVIEYKMSNL